MAGALDRLTVSQREIADGSITLPKRRTYDSSAIGKYKETHVRIKFGAATVAYDTLTCTPHNLGKVPQIWEVVERGIDSTVAGARPGEIYTDTPAPFSRTHAAFRCTVPNTWAVIALR